MEITGANYLIKLLNQQEMKKLYITFLLSVIVIKLLYPQGNTESYVRAEKYLYFNIQKLVKNLEVRPNWVDKQNFLWFEKQTEKGYKFMLVRCKSGRVQDAFDHQKIADLLTKELKKDIKPDSLPFREFKYGDKLSSIEFKLNDTINVNINLSNYFLNKIKNENRKLNKNESLSPDGKWMVFIRNYNLFAKSIPDGEEFALSIDGIDKNDYASPISWYKIVDESKGDIYDPEIDIVWSPDSKKFIAAKIDRRSKGKLFLFQSTPDSGYRAKIWSYERSLPGEMNTANIEYFVFNPGEKSVVKVNLDPFAECLNWNNPEWLDNKTAYFRKFTRGYKAYDFYFIDTETGKCSNPIHEVAKTMIEYQMVDAKVTTKGDKIIWLSERDGWGHLYLINGITGQVINQITKGEYVVHSIQAMDEKNKTIWFIAGGKEFERDPYYKHLYKVNFNGSDLKLLTPEDADHSVWISPDNHFFVDNFSRADQKPKAVLRSMLDGKLIADIQESDISKLLATGWKYPKPFKVKGRDGITDIFGLLFYPTNFDATKKYPVIDATYTGPQAVRTAKSFIRAYRNDDVPIAELGFIVMTIDGFGTAFRSKAFHDVSYMNLGDIGAADHIGGLRQLARLYPYLDTTRVGIYGHSAGGYDAAHALFTHPEFYKVGVSTAGNHDNMMSKEWWDEQYMGMPGKHYLEQSNLSLAKNLQGKLLIVTGDMDNNVNPANTLRLAGELIKANKDFDMIIFPNKDHGSLYYDLYLIRKRWDYFVKYLLGVEPPKEFEIKKN